MTLLVGILAKDGVAIAADRAVTFGDGEQRPTIADSHKKIAVIGGSVIVVGTGQVGLGQRFREIVRVHWDNRKFSKNPVETGTDLTKIAVQNFGSTNVHSGQPRGIGLGSLVAYELEDKPRLIEFQNGDFQPENKTEQCWYASMGSGQALADPYLALMRRSVWKEGQPSIEEATFAAYWVMLQAIAAAPGFISEPIDMAVLRKSGKKYEARELLPDQLEEHKNRAQVANDQLRQALLGQLPTVSIAPPIPEPPSQEKT